MKITNAFFSIMSICSGGLVPSTSVNPLIFPQTPSDFIFEYSDELYPPFDITDKIVISGSYKYINKMQTPNCRQILKTYCSAYSDTTAYRTTQGSSFTMYADNTYEYSYTLSNVKSYLKYGIRCEVGIKAEKFTELLNPVSFTIHAKTYDEIDPAIYKNSPYIISNSVKGNGEVVSESFLFNNFRDYIDEDIYKVLNLKDFSFIYDYPLPFTYNSAYLDIVDLNNCFPNLPTISGINKRIPLTLTQTSNTISFSFPNPMYVNVETLEMSLSQISGTVETRNFYMPKNKKTLLQSLKMILRVDGIGANKISFNYPIEFNSGDNFLGDCNDSDYCVVGGIKK